METTVHTITELLKLRGADGGIHVRGDLRVCCDIPIVERHQIVYIHAGRDILAGRDIRADGYIRAGEDIYWSQMHLPTASTISCQHVLPAFCQRECWRERLARWEIDMDGCYSQIIPRVQEQLDKILTSDQWTPTERWMLERLRHDEVGADGTRLNRSRLTVRECIVAMWRRRIGK